MLPRPSDASRGAFTGVGARAQGRASVSTGVVLSVLAHAGTFFVLGIVEPAPARPALREPIEVEVVQTTLEPVAEEPTPEPPAPEPEPAPDKPVPRLRPPKELAVAPPPKPADTKPPAAAEETLADFSGTTLTGDSAGGWVSNVGNGATMVGPIGKANAAVTGRNASGVAGGVVGGSGDATGLRIAGPGDLSRPPQQPDQDVLNAALERNYPKPARMQGIEGTSRTRVLILASGKTDRIRVLNETPSGYAFAEACRQTLRDVRFKPALDLAGKPVAFEIDFPCTFSVE